MGRSPRIALTKSEGDEQLFDDAKLRASLLRAGADDDLTKIVMRDVQREVRHGDSTDAIRRIVMRALKREARHLAGRYNLKRAIQALGPSGFPFERYWGALLESLGYKTSFDITVRGRCVDHEIDVFAEKGRQRRLAECKFHNTSSRRTDLRVALYVYARCLDLRRRKSRPPGRERFELVTNTRFTSEATRYAKCVRLNLVSWDYPSSHSLRELIDRSACYPITCLTTLRARPAKMLLARDVVTCRQLIAHRELLTEVGLTDRQITALVAEATPLSRIGEVVGARQAGGLVSGIVAASST